MHALFVRFMHAHGRLCVCGCAPGVGACGLDLLAGRVAVLLLHLVRSLRGLLAGRCNSGAALVRPREAVAAEAECQSCPPGSTRGVSRLRCLERPKLVP